MTTNESIEILEALASGYSPITGEILDNESVLQERNVIRALQIAIDQLKREHPQEQQYNTEIKIPDEEIISAIELFKGQKQKATPNQLACLFLATRKFKNEMLVSDKLYGKYSDTYSKGQLLDFFTRYLDTYHQAKEKKKGNDRPQKRISFFDKKKFNNLSEKSITNLKNKINELGVLKTENLSEYVQMSRKFHARSYEPWSDTEKMLLEKALQYTNDLQLLSECFQRGKDSIRASGERILYQSQIQQTDGNDN